MRTKRKASRLLLNPERETLCNNNQQQQHNKLIKKHSNSNNKRYLPPFHRTFSTFSHRLIKNMNTSTSLSSACPVCQSPLIQVKLHPDAPQEQMILCSNTACHYPMLEEKLLSNFLLIVPTATSIATTPTQSAPQALSQSTSLHPQQHSQLQQPITQVQRQQEQQQQQQTTVEISQQQQQQQQTETAKTQTNCGGSSEDDVSKNNDDSAMSSYRRITSSFGVDELFDDSFL